MRKVREIMNLIADAEKQLESGEKRIAELTRQRRYSEIEHVVFQMKVWTEFIEKCGELKVESPEEFKDERVQDDECNL